MLPINIIEGPQFDYIQKGNPTIDVNPRTLYATWLNIVSGELFICINKSEDANVWSGQHNTLIAARSVIPQDGLIMYWSFDVVDGSVVYDEVGDFDGDVLNGALLVDGAVGTGIEFVGTESHTLVSDVVIEPATNASLQSFSSWIKGYGTLFGSNADSTGEHHIKISVSATGVVVGTSYYGGDTSDTSTDIVMDIAEGWHHVVYVKTAPYLYDVYFDGSLIGSDLYKTADEQSNLCLGKTYGTAYYACVMDEVSVYSRSLLPSEVATIYNYGLGHI